MILRDRTDQVWQVDNDEMFVVLKPARYCNKWKELNHLCLSLKDGSVYERVESVSAFAKPWEKLPYLRRIV